MADKRDLWNERAQPAVERDDAASRDLAVALSYDPARDNAPQVVASGKGILARQILDLAFAHGIKVRTDPDLAQMLAVLEIGSVIPAEAFLAVAEILAYVYRANGGPPLAGTRV